MLDLKVLKESDFLDYQLLLDNAVGSMFFHSLKYKLFLSKVLPSSKDFYLGFYLKSELIICIPLFKMKTKYGTVINSLPFYGSHGGLIYKKETDLKYINEAIEIYNNFLIENNFLSSTIIEPLSIFNSGENPYKKLNHNFKDTRIGQVTQLPDSLQNRADVEDHLMSMFHQKTRNMVRKSLSFGFDISHSNDLEVLDFLASTHYENIIKLKGKPKDREIFLNIKNSFDYDNDYRIYTASINGQLTSALLLFYFEDFVEYFTPVIKYEFRNMQPLTNIIFNSMCDATLEKKTKYWNWGGTWMKGQEGVYRFKNRFGATDYKYNYYIYVNSFLENLPNEDLRGLSEKFPNYFLKPFD